MILCVKLCKVIMEINAENNKVINKLMKATTVILFSILALSSAQIIGLSNNASLESSPATPSITYDDYALNITNLNQTNKVEVDNCLALLNDSNVFLDSIQLAAAIERLYSDGYREYYLYIDVADSNQNIHEFEAVISIDSASIVYTLQNITEIPLDNVTNFDTNGTTPVIQPLITQSIKSANSLTDLYASIAQGYSFLSQNDTKSDSSLADLQADLQKNYPVVSNLQQAAAYSKPIGLSTSYIVFYADSNSKVYSAYGVVDNLNKVHYIISVNQIDTSSVHG